ncbi:MAG: serine phosphatase RsbU (regulator of sigma subunit) [Crocinitomicaceae bacterium]|jgi:serine phosphatase RsbU (regulator of sigma subunit)
MKSANKRIFLGFILLISVFAISEFISFRNLEKSKEISSRNTQIFQPSIIYLSEFELMISDAENYTESWVYFDITDHDDKKSLKELHALGAKKLTEDLVKISKLWKNSADEKLLKVVVNTLDTVMIEQSSIMSKLDNLEAYSSENWLVLIEVEDEHLARVKELSHRSRKDLNVLTAHMKARSLKEKNVAQASFNSIRIVHIVLAVLVLFIGVIVAWSILRFLRSEKQRQVITEERDDIKSQKAIIEEKNEEILSSISYAERLQTSMLPSKEDISKNFKEHFIFFRPRDIVSGDFYWYREISSEGRSLVMIAAADATGHGVPGAFVSFVCYSSLNRAVDEYKLTSPGRILDKVSEMVAETFTSTDANSELYDGMDISLCVFDFNAQELHFSGANNSGYVLRDGEMNKLVASRKSVGRGGDEVGFIEQQWKLKAGDYVYLFSDGFQDQFGGEKGKKYRGGRFLEFLKAIGQKGHVSKDQLESEFEEWKGEEEQLDDVLVIGLKIEARNKS